MVTTKIRIVTADDHPLFLQGLRQAIESDTDLEIVAEACDGKAALEKIRQLSPDIAVVDVAMPGLDGIELVRALTEEGSTVSPIFLTMYREKKMLDRTLELGVKGYVLKDSAATDIIKAIHTVHSGEYFISPALTSYIVESTRKAARAGSSDDAAMVKLSRSERRVLDLIAEYKTSKEIADELCVSPRTVENHRTHICQKLGLYGNHALMKFAISHKQEGDPATDVA